LKLELGKLELLFDIFNVPIFLPEKSLSFEIIKVFFSEELRILFLLFFFFSLSLQALNKVISSFISFI
jgi:hypothetical protein